MFTVATAYYVSPKYPVTEFIELSRNIHGLVTALITDFLTGSANDVFALSYVA